MVESDHAITRRASDLARAFGLLIRGRRHALAMSQDQLALATGVGRRFLIDLESGKLSCQLGRSLVIAEALGLRPIELMQSQAEGGPVVATLADLPEWEQENG